MNNVSIMDEQIFLRVVTILNEIGIKWWIDHGTLLGYIRDNQPILWDRDFDIGTSVEVNYLIESVFPIISREFPSAYIDSLASALKIPFYDFNGNIWSIDIASYQFKNEVATKYWPNLSGATATKKILAIALNVLSGSGINSSDKMIVKIISLLFKPLGFFFRLTINLKKRHEIIANMSRFLPYRENSVDSNYFKHLKKIKIMNIDVNVPVMHNEYLLKRYGESWKVPIKSWNYLIDDGGNNYSGPRRFG